METLQAIYIALAVFGAGVTIVDLFGALDHGSDSGHGHDSGAHAGAAHGSGHDTGGHDGAGQAHVGHDGGGHDALPAGAHDDTGHVALLGGTRPEADRPADSGQEKSAAVARVISVLRTAVYFSLGSGATGLAALATGLGVFQSLLWAAGAGVGIAFLARALRRLVRRDLDSSFVAEDFILEEAEITVPVAPGMIGKAVVRKFGAQAEVYVRATAPQSAFARGDLVRIIDIQEDCYLVEAADAEHLVH